MRKIAITPAFLLLCGLVHAAPVYLDCVTKFEHPERGAAAEFKFSIKIDEASGNITHTEPDGSAFNAKGFFSANEISYQHADASKTFLTTTSYQVNRTSLSVARTHSAALTPEGMDLLRDWKDSKSSTTSNGACEVVNVTKRKI